ncbi:HlyD family secretion protein [Sphingobacterium chungjuense]|uniref:hypothetical protein n=1 Tax=Sphingobacterium chungjuense TaxID=2675553 RepID=UPI00140D91D4|nr:hypothetical protein [Sphingobacterium chungjuense]
MNNELNKKRPAIRTPLSEDYIPNLPSWMSRRCSYIIYINLVIVISILLFFKYPEYSTGRMEIVGIHSAKPVFSQVEGYIDSLLVNDSSHVVKNQLLATIKTQANFDHIIVLLESLEGVHDNHGLHRIFNNLLTIRLNLGELNIDYVNLLRSYRRSQDKLSKIDSYLTNSFYSSTIDSTHTKLKQRINASHESQTESVISHDCSDFIYELNSFIAKLQEWREQYLIFAPSDGMLIVNKNIEANKVVGKYDLLFRIATSKNTEDRWVLWPDNGKESFVVGEKLTILLLDRPDAEKNRFPVHVTDILAHDDHTNSIRIHSNLPYPNDYVLNDDHKHEPIRVKIQRRSSSLLEKIIARLRKRII